MKLLFVGNFQGPGNATGEEPDERHMAKCLSQAGVIVTTVSRDEVHAFHTGAKKDNLPEPEDFDIILVAKWAHYTAEMMDILRERYKGKLVYWVWDFMFAPHRRFWTPDWHKMMQDVCDVYISGELGMTEVFNLEPKTNFRYFNWDSSDGQYDQIEGVTPVYDVGFTGTYIPHSYRNDMLRKVNDKFNLTIFSWDHEEWRNQGFTAVPGMYGGDFPTISAQTKVLLCMNWPEVTPETHGYWSNRVGKVMTTGGLPLVHYVPGMERSLSDAPMYFQDADDMNDKIKWLLSNDTQRETARVKAYDYGRQHMTTQKRMQEFKILLESL